MDTSYIFPILVMSAIVIILVLSAIFSKKAIIKRKLKNAPTKRISSFRSGEVAKFVGEVSLIDEPLIAPLSKRPCAYFHVIVEQKVSSGKNTHWKTIIEETDSVKYLLKDASGFAMIKKKYIKSYVVLDRKFSSGTFKDAEANLENYLQKHGKKSEGTFGWNKTIRYREGVLEEGELVAVLGEGKWRQPEALGLSNEYDRILVMKDSEKSPVYLSDDPSTTKKEDLKSRHRKKYS